MPAFYDGWARGWGRLPALNNDWYPGPYGFPEGTTIEEIEQFDKAVELPHMFVHDSTVGPGVLPEDLTIPEHLDRLADLVRRAHEEQGWLGARAREELLEELDDARRKLAQADLTRPDEDDEGHRRAAWAELVKFRDKLREAYEEWIEHTEDEREAWARSHPGVPFIPRYDDAPIPSDAADERAWALLEPNAAYLIDQLAPPGRGESRRDERESEIRGGEEDREGPNGGRR